MKMIVGWICIGYVFLVLFLYDHIEKKIMKNKKLEKNIIYPPVLYLYNGILILFLIIPVPIAFFLGIDDFYGALICTIGFCVPAIIVAIIFILIGVNWRIIINETDFVLIGFTKKEKRFKYTEVTLKLFKQCYRVYFENKRICTISFILHRNCNLLSNKILSEQNK